MNLASNKSLMLFYIPVHVVNFMLPTQTIHFFEESVLHFCDSSSDSPPARGLAAVCHPTARGVRANRLVHSLRVARLRAPDARRHVRRNGDSGQRQNGL